MYFGIGAQWRDGNIYISSVAGLHNEVNFDTLGDIIASGYYIPIVGSIAHEGKHLEQGGPTAMSVYGEFEGWKTQLEIVKEMFQEVPANGTIRDIILRTPLTHDPEVLGMIWRGMVDEQGYDYLVWILPLDSDSKVPAILTP